MILCVTLNPCLDKTLTVPPWKPGEHQVRGTAVRSVVGGKGNNVARALSRLGRQARPAMPLGGAVGRLCEDLLRTEDGLDPITVPIAATTRVILTVRTDGSQDQTAFFDPDPVITADESAALAQRIDEVMAAEPVELLTLSGSSPAIATHPLYSELIALAKARRVPVLLDTYGPAFDAVWGFWPEVVQMNRREASHALGRNGRAADAEIFTMLGGWARHGVQLGIITDGAGPVLGFIRGEQFRVNPPNIDAINPIGSGDCLLAGLADGWLSGLETEAMIRHGIACAVANALVWDAGAIEPGEVARLESEIVIEPLGRLLIAQNEGSLFRHTSRRR